MASSLPQIDTDLVRPAGLEPATLGLEGRCSIQLSYGQLTYQIKLISGLSLFIIGRGGEIRTPDILLPKQARYQAALHPDCEVSRVLHDLRQAGKWTLCRFSRFCPLWVALNRDLIANLNAQCLCRAARNLQHHGDLKIR